MSGHSKWASIKHKKGAADAKRGRVFSRIAKEITVAVKSAGSNPDMNPRLRMAISAAKGSNMPNDNIKKAIQRGTGELPGVTYDEITYEAYGPGGVAIIIESLTDNKNRTSAEIRSLLSKKGGNLSGAGSVAWQFQRKGLITVDKKDYEEETVLNIAIEAGAEDLKVERDAYEIITDPKDFEAVKDALSKNNIKTNVVELTSLPSSTVKIKDEKLAGKVLDLIEVLEENDDVQNVYANCDIPDEILDKLG